MFIENDALKNRKNWKKFWINRKCEMNGFMWNYWDGGGGLNTFYMAWNFTSNEWFLQTIENIKFHFCGILGVGDDKLHLLSPFFLVKKKLSRNKTMIQFSAKIFGFLFFEKLSVLWGKITFWRKSLNHKKIKISSIWQWCFHFRWIFEHYEWLSENSYEMRTENSITLFFMKYWEWWGRRIGRKNNIFFAWTRI